MKTVSLTFDYELFFNKSGTFKNSLFRPTNDLLKALDAKGIKATFFIDVLYYSRLLEVNIEEAKILREQLQLLVAKGQRIELHLHPHWLDAKYEGPEWIFPNYDHYKLQSLPEEKVTDLFVSGSEILNEIASEVSKNYKVIAFRAGGWSIAPFDKLKQGFLKSGIQIDSSIAFGMKIKASPFDFDYTNAPNYDCYKFCDDPTKVDAKAIFYEIPITTFSNNLSNKIYNRFFRFYYFTLNKFADKVYGDGSYMSINTPKGLERICAKISPAYEFLSIENNSPYLLINRIEKLRKNLFVIMSHPKGLSQSSFDCIKSLSCQNYHFLTLYDLLKQNIIDDLLPT